MALRFEGVIPPVTTPFGEEGEVLYQALERNLERYLGTELSGLLLLGSNGELGHLLDDEKRSILELADGLIPSDRSFLVGVSAPTELSWQRTLEWLSRFRIDAVLLSVPSYYKNRMGTGALVRFFERAADASPFPILLYNVPQYSGLEIPVEALAVLAQHDRIVGMKDSSGNLTYTQRVLEVTATREFQVLMGSAQVLGPSLLLGIRGAILAVACAFPDLPLNLMREFEQARPVAERQAWLFRLAMALTTEFGVPGLKYAMDLAGLEGGLCRPPLLPLNEQEKARIQELVQAYLQWEGARVLT